MDLRRLHHIVTLAEDGNFRRAAEKVHLSQPAFSRSIQAAEAELGLKLFDRGTLEATCTPAGAFVVERARGVLQQQRKLERDVSLFRERLIGDFAFGSGPFPAAQLVPSLLADMRKRYPGVCARVQINNPHYLLGYVEREEHDFFIANTVEVPRNGAFEVRSIGRMPGAFYVRGGHPLLKRESIQVADMMPFGMGTGRLSAWISARLVELMGLPEASKLPVAVECDDVHILKRIAMDSDTVIIGTNDLFAQELAAGTIEALPLRDLPTPHANLGIVTLAGRTASPVAAYAMDFLAGLADRLQPA